METRCEHRFGSSTWTEDKLSIIIKYLDFYTTALKNRKWKLIYIDAFAGTGSREYDDEDGNTLSSPGSVLRALTITIPFDEYHFIEKDHDKAEELKRKLTEFGNHTGSVWEGDANQEVPRIIQRLKGSLHRGVIFLDPFAMTVEWQTLEAIAKSGILDLWFLVPFGAIARTLPRDGEMQESWRQKLIKTFGEDPIPQLYKTVCQQSLFGDTDDLKEFGIDEERKIRVGGSRELGRYILNRLSKPFSWVSKEVIVLKNSNNSPMFLLVYAISNPSGPAIGLAMNVIKDILKKYEDGGGCVERFCD